MPQVDDDQLDQNNEELSRISEVCFEFDITQICPGIVGNNGSCIK